MQGALLKQFLTNNKIYFETILVLLLGAMAISVSLSANHIATAQLQLATEAQKVAILPYQPNISARFKYLPSLGSTTKGQLLITNDGDTAAQLQIEPIAFLDLHELQIIPINGPATRSVHLQRALLGLNHYFPNITLINDESKHFELTQEIDNIDALALKIDELSKSQNSNTTSLTGYVEKYVKVFYLDRFKTEHVDYFRFDPSGEGVLMSRSEGEAMFSRYATLQQSHQTLDYWDASKEDIATLWRAKRA